MNRKAQAISEKLTCLNSRSRGQAAIEFMVLVAFFLIFVTAIVLAMLDLSGGRADAVALEQAQQAARDIGTAADQVYIQGANAEVRKQVFFPAELGNVFIGSQPPVGRGHEVILRMNTSRGSSDVVVMTVGTVKESNTPGKKLNARLGAGLREVRIWNDKANNVVVVEYAN
ncbi:MAG: hypothetical protein WC759_05225 [Candidatus Micrarchaeia archaeon]|jgi:hypothetical protein